jgi:hypothetical protein
MRLGAHLTAAAMGAAAIGILAIILGCGAEGAERVAPTTPVGAAPTPAAPPGAPVCTRDAECPGDQVCRNGACRTPR